MTETNINANICFDELGLYKFLIIQHSLANLHALLKFFCELYIIAIL